MQGALPVASNGAAGSRAVQGDAVRRAVALAIMAALAACQPRQQGAALPLDADSPPSLGATPCADSLYVVLRSKPLDAMSEREYEYFTRKDAECDAYRLAAASRQDVAVATASPHESSKWPRAAETASDSVRANPPAARHHVGLALGLIAVGLAVLGLYVLVNVHKTPVGW
jgi:hypothetical protein